LLVGAGANSAHTAETDRGGFQQTKKVLAIELTHYVQQPGAWLIAIDEIIKPKQ
jgi:hypothetical protein